MDKQVDQDAEFSRRAARTLSSPYWQTLRGDPSHPNYLARAQKTRAALARYAEALSQAASYDDLPDDMKAIFDEQALSA